MFDFSQRYIPYHAYQMKKKIPRDVKLRHTYIGIHIRIFVQSILLGILKNAKLLIILRKVESKKKHLKIVIFLKLTATELLN